MKLYKIMYDGPKVIYFYKDSKGNYKIRTQVPESWTDKAKRYKLNYREFNQVGGDK